MKGIVESNELWASSAYFLNDSSEIFYGYNVLKEALESWIQACGRSSESLSLGLAQELLQGFGGGRLSKDVIDPVYLACFCENGNLLSQWRAYGQSGGYALAFNFRPSFPSFDQLEAFKPEPVSYTSRLIKVEYERTKQLARCKYVLDEVLSYFDNPEMLQAIQEVASLDDPNKGYGEIYRILADTLMEEAVGFKDKAFDVEKEWRLVVRQREPHQQDESGYPPVPVHSRLARELLIPYVKLLPCNGSKVPLVSVRSGPTIDPLLAFLSLRPFLDKYGFNRVLTKHSGISARF